MSLATAPTWGVHLPTAVETCIRAALGPLDPAAPWPHTRALSALDRLGARRAGPPRTLGAGRGTPLVASQTLRWAGLDLEVEAFRHLAGEQGEAALSAPPWDDLVAGEAGEAEWWDLVDVFLEAVGARHGAVVDGEPIELADPDPAAVRRRLRRHAALLVAPWLAEGAGSRACAYRSLPASGLCVLLR